MSGFTRRSFFKIVASSGAAVAAGGCGNDVNELVGNIPEKLIPYVVPPDNIVPGVAAYFSTVCRECPAGCGLVAKNRDGRVIKLEGNPDHPVNAGLSAFAVRPRCRGSTIPTATAARSWRASPWHGTRRRSGSPTSSRDCVKAKQGSKIALVTGLETGSLGRLMDEWTRGAGRAAAHHLRAARLRSAPRRQSRDVRPRQHSSLRHRGRGLPPLLRRRLPRDVGSNVANTSAFTKMHALGRGKAGTFVAVEPRQSMTAGNADEWLRSAPGTEGVVALAMLKVIRRGGPRGEGGRWRLAARRGEERRPRQGRRGLGHSRRHHQAHRPRLRGRQERAGPGRRGGDHGPQATDALIAVNLLNSGRRRRRRDHTLRRRFGARQGESLLGDGEAHQGDGARARSKSSILADVNPVYAMPPKSGFAEALAKVPLVVSLASRPTDTSGRGRARPARRSIRSSRGATTRLADGVIGLMQPTMGPVADRRQAGRGQGHRRHPALRRTPGPRHRGGQGPAQVGELRGLREGAVAGLGARVRRGQESASISGRSRSARGGAWRAPRTAASGGAAKFDASRLSVEAAKLEGDGTHALIVYPSLALLRRTERRPALAAGSARHHDPGGVGRLGRGARRRPRASSACRGAMWSS